MANSKLFNFGNYCVGLILFWVSLATSAATFNATPNPSTTGNYNVQWSGATSGIVVVSEVVNGVNQSIGGGSPSGTIPVSGKAPGRYTYKLEQKTPGSGTGYGAPTQTTSVDVILPASSSARSASASSVINSSLGSSVNVSSSSKSASVSSSPVSSVIGSSSRSSVSAPSSSSKSSAVSFSSVSSVVGSSSRSSVIAPSSSKSSSASFSSSANVPTFFSATPNPSTTGIYTLEWSGAVYGTVVVSEVVNGANTPVGGGASSGSIPISGKPTGRYTYILEQKTPGVGTGYGAPTQTLSVDVNLPTPTVATPTISPNGGTFTSAQTVTLSTSPSDATIRYTTNGSAVTESSPAYSVPFVLNSSATVKAKAFKTGYNASGEAGAGFTINLPASFSATPNPSTTGSYTLQWSGAVYGTVVVSEVVNGANTPVGGGASSGSIPISGKPTGRYTYILEQKTPGVGTGYGAPTQTLFVDVNLPTPKVSTPTINPNGGTFSSPQTVSISTSTSDATIRYTTDGSTVTQSSPEYSAPLVLDGSATVKAKAFKAGYSASDEKEAAFIINGFFVKPNPSTDGTYTLFWSGAVFGTVVVSEVVNGVSTAVGGGSAIGSKLISGKPSGRYTYILEQKTPGIGTGYGAPTQTLFVDVILPASSSASVSSVQSTSATSVISSSVSSANISSASSHSLMSSFSSVSSSPNSQNTTRYEAEDALFFKGKVATEHAGYSGTGFVDYDSSVGSYVEWTINASYAGTATLDFRYGNGDALGTSRTMDIFVNNVPHKGGVVFSGTGNWKAWVNQTLSVSLKAGVNKIRAVALLSKGGPNVDYLDVNIDPVPSFIPNLSVATLLPVTSSAVMPYVAEANSMGDAEIRIPVDVVPGVNGHQPKLTLSYSSNRMRKLLHEDREEDNLGAGWRLGGLSSIRACGKRNLANIDPLDFGPNQFTPMCIDGQLFVQNKPSPIIETGSPPERGSLVTPWYEQDHEYVLFNDTGVKIRAIGQNSIGNGGKYKVYYPDGSVSEYGATADSYLNRDYILFKDFDDPLKLTRRENEPANHVHVGSSHYNERHIKTPVYYLNKHTDAFGNEISYEYYKDEVNAYVMPKRISYGPQSTPDTEIEFGFQMRVPGDITVVPPRVAAYLFGGAPKASSALGINKITIKHNNQSVTEYNLVHEELQTSPLLTPTTLLTRLKHVQKCAFKSGIRDCLSPLTISWDGDSADKVLTRVNRISDNQGSWTEFDYKPVASDVLFSESPFGAAPTQYTLVTEKPVPDRTTIYEDGEWEPSVLVEMRTSNGLAGNRTLKYRYLGEGIDSLKGWGFMGYHGVRIEDVSRGIFTYKQYSLDHRYIGKSMAEVTMLGAYGGSGSKMLSKNVSIMDSIFLYHGQYRFLGSANLIMGSPAHSWYNYPRQTIQFKYENGQQIGVLIKENKPEFTAWQNGSDTGFQYPFLRETTITRWANNASLVTGTEPHTWGVYTLSGISGVQRSKQVDVEFQENREFDSLLISFPQQTRTRVYSGDVTGAAEQTITEAKTPYIINGKARSVVESHTRHVGNSDLESTVLYAYNGDGVKTSESLSGPSFNSRTTSFSNFAARRYPQTITNALGQGTNYQYDEATGRVTSTTDLNGLTTTVDYDAFGREEVVTNPDNVSVTTRYDFCSALGNCPSVNGVAAYSRIKQTSPVSPDIYKYLDSLGREIRLETQGFDGVKNVLVDTLYDTFGQVDEKSLPYYSGETPRYIDHDYDLLGRLLKTTNPDGSYKEIAYDVENGQKVVTRTAYVKDSQGVLVGTKINKSFFNAIDEVVKTTDAANTTEQISTEFKFYATGLTENIKVGGVQVASFIYDAAGNRTTLNDQNAGTVTSKYNALGELRYSIDNAGQRKDYTYDLLGRPKTETTDDGVQNWFYDPTNSIGGLDYTEFTDSRSGYYHKRTMGYYNNSKPSDITSQIRVPGFNVRTYNQHFTYDSYGRSDTVSFPSGISVKSTYNTAGYLAGVDDTQGNSLQSITAVDVLGNVTQMSYGSGINSSRSYNPLTGRLESVLTTSNITLQNNTFKWRSDGLLESRSTSIGQQKAEQFGYDNLSRLRTSTTTAGSSTRTTTTDYALNGNILSKTANNSVGNIESQATGFQYGTTTNAGPNAVSVVTIDGVQNSLYYNANGGITYYDASAGADRFVEWTARGNPWRLTKGAAQNDTDPDARDEIAYGVDGERYFKKSTWKNSSNVQQTEYTFYVGDYEDLLPANDPQYTQVERSRINDNVMHIRTTTHLGVVEKSIEFLHKDHLGSIEAITDINGNLLVQMSFDAFGSRRKTNWAGSLTNAETESLLAQVGVGTSRGYTGHEHLDRTGFIHMNGRVYDPTLGRFLSPDPFVQSPYFSQSYNRYSYVWNNPMGMTDPSGYLVSPLPNAAWGYRITLDGFKHEDESKPKSGSSDTQDTSASETAGDAQHQNVTSQTEGEATSQVSRGGEGPTDADGTENVTVIGTTPKKERTLGSYLPFTEAGGNAAQYWASRIVNSEGDFWDAPISNTGLYTGLVFASMWTEDTAAEVSFTLGTGGIGTLGSVSLRANAYVASLLLKYPSLLRWLPQAGVRGTLQSAGWSPGALRASTKARDGWSMVLNPGPSARLQWSNAGGRHGGSYWKLTGPDYGTQKFHYFFSKNDF